MDFSTAAAGGVVQVRGRRGALVMAAAPGAME